jgi:glycine cleavage system aminomethyltransferase T
MLKLDKPDFLGKGALMEAAERPVKERLVGFVAERRVVPPEGSAILRDGTWVGRVTSARRSDATGHVIGLCWVPADMAEEGIGFDITFDGSSVHATVRRPPFYDPEGARLKA